MSWADDVIARDRARGKLGRQPTSRIGRYAASFGRGALETVQGVGDVVSTAFGSRGLGMGITAAREAAQGITPGGAESEIRLNLKPGFQQRPVTETIKDLVGRGTQVVGPTASALDAATAWAPKVLAGAAGAAVGYAPMDVRKRDAIRGQDPELIKRWSKENVALRTAERAAEVIGPLAGMFVGPAAAGAQIRGAARGLKAGERILLAGQKAPKPAKFLSAQRGKFFRAPETVSPAMALGAVAMEPTLAGIGAISKIAGRGRKAQHAAGMEPGTAKVASGLVPTAEDMQRAAEILGPTIRTGKRADVVGKLIAAGFGAGMAHGVWNSITNTIPHAYRTGDVPEMVAGSIEAVGHGYFAGKMAQHAFGRGVHSAKAQREGIERFIEREEQTAKDPGLVGFEEIRGPRRSRLGPSGLAEEATDSAIAARARDDFDAFMGKIRSDSKIGVKFPEKIQIDGKMVDRSGNRITQEELDAFGEKYGPEYKTLMEESLRLQRELQDFQRPDLEARAAGEEARELREQKNAQRRHEIEERQEEIDRLFAKGLPSERNRVELAQEEARGLAAEEAREQAEATSRAEEFLGPEVSRGIEEAVQGAVGGAPGAPRLGGPEAAEARAVEARTLRQSLMAPEARPGDLIGPVQEGIIQPPGAGRERVDMEALRQLAAAPAPAVDREGVRVGGGEAGFVAPGFPRGPVEGPPAPPPEARGVALAERPPEPVSTKPPIPEARIPEPVEPARVARVDERTAPVLGPEARAAPPEVPLPTEPTTGAEKRTEPATFREYAEARGVEWPVRTGTAAEKAAHRALLADYQARVPVDAPAPPAEPKAPEPVPPPEPPIEAAPVEPEVAPPEPKAAPAEPKPAPAPAEGIRVTFAKKPSAAVRKTMKATGFSWDRKQKAYVGPQNAKAEKLARRLEEKYQAKSSLPTVVGEKRAPAPAREVLPEPPKDERGLVHETADVMVAGIAQDQRMDPAGRYVVKEYEGGEGPAQFVKRYGIPSHKKGTPLEDIEASPKQMAAALKRDKGNQLEKEIHEAVEKDPRVEEAVEAEKAKAETAPPRLFGLIQQTAAGEQRLIPGALGFQRPTRTEGREGEGPLFTQAQDARIRAEERSQMTLGEGVPRETVPEGQERYPVKAVTPEELARAEKDPDYFPQEETVGYIDAATERAALASLESRQAEFPEGAELGAVTRFAVAEKAPPFFSHLRNVVDRIKQPSGNARDFLKFLSSPKQGVKAEELKWTGLRQFLEERKGKVTKEEMQRFLDENDVQIQEVTKGDAEEVNVSTLRAEVEQLNEKTREAEREWSAVRGDISQLDDANIRLSRETEASGRLLETGTSEQIAAARGYWDAVDAYADKSNQLEGIRAGRAATATKFGQWQLPGAKEGSYRELLLTLGPKKGEQARLKALEQELRAAEAETYRLIDSRVSEPARWEAAKKREVGLRQQLAAPDKEAYTAGHWDEPNVLAHVRFNERTGPNGERVLFVEEAQSDWHQAAKRARGQEVKRLMEEKGLSEDEATKRVLPDFGYAQPRWDVYDVRTNNIVSRFRSKEAAQRWVNSEENNFPRIKPEHTEIREGVPEGVPHAPFAGATKSPWHEMAMRRMVRWGAEEGYDRISWINGEETIKRYDLSKQVSRLEYTDDGKLIAYDLDGTKVKDLAVRPEELENQIGKEPAERLLGAEPSLEVWEVRSLRTREVQSTHAREAEAAAVAKEAAVYPSGSPFYTAKVASGVRFIEGEDLKIGGEWAKNLYDVMLPSAMKKFGKQWGAEVGETGITVGPAMELRVREVEPGRFDVFDQDGTPVSVLHKSRAKARARADEILAENQSRKAFLSLDITPAMRESVVAKGVPKFATREGRERVVGHGAEGMQIGLAQAKAAFPGARFSKAVPPGRGPGFLATLPNGARILIEPDRHIYLDRAQWERSQQEGARWEFRPGMKAAGVFERRLGLAPDLSWDGIVQLAGDAPAGVAFHESWHAAKALALSEKQRADVAKMYPKGEEAEAEAYAEWATKPTKHGIFQQIRRFFQRIYRAFLPTVESRAERAFEAVRTGKAWEGRGVAGARGPPRFAVAPIPKPEAPKKPAREPSVFRQVQAVRVPGLKAPRLWTQIEAEDAASMVARMGGTGGATTGKPPGEPINLERLNITDESKAGFSRAQEAIKGKGEGVKGKVTFAETKVGALRLLGIANEEQLARAAQHGLLINKESSVAVRTLVQEKRVKSEKANAALKEAEASGRGVEEARETALAAATDYGNFILAARGQQAEAGRALAAYKIMVGPRSPAEILVGRLFRESGGLKKEQVAKIIQAVEKPETLADAVQEALRPTTMTKLLEWWKAGLLSGISTQAANITGNTLKQGMKLGEVYFTSHVTEPLLAKAQGRDVERMSGEAGRSWAAIRARAPEANARLWQELADAATLKPERVSGVEHRKLEHQVGAISGKKGRFVRIPFRALTAFDRWFRVMAEEQELYRRAWREASGDSTKAASIVDGFKAAQDVSERAGQPVAARWQEMEQAVRKAGLEETFQDDPGKLASLLMTGKRHFRGLEMVFPFVRTPARILAATVERTPAPLVASLWGGGVAKKFKQHRAGEITGGELADAITKPLLGTMFASTMAAAAQAGWITGGGPSDWEEKNLKRQTGWQPYSFVVPDGQGGVQYVSFNRFEPVSSIMGMAADLAEIQDEKKAGDMLQKIGGSIAENLTNKTYLRGLRDASLALSDPTRYAGGVVKNIAGTVIPTIVAKTAQAMDPVLRDIRAEKTGMAGIPEAIGKKIQSRIPGASKLLPPRRTGLGEPIVREGTAAERFAAPWYRTGAKGAEADLERLLVDIGYTPGRPSRDVTIPGTRGQKVRLSDKEYAFMERAREQAADRARRWVRSPGFRRLGPEEQRDRIERLFSRASSDARRRLMPRLRRRLRRGS